MDGSRFFRPLQSPVGVPEMERQAEVDKCALANGFLELRSIVSSPSLKIQENGVQMEGVPADGKQEVEWQALDQKNEHNMEKSRSVTTNEQETRGMERVQVKESLQMKDQIVEQETVRLQQCVSKMGRGRERVRKTHVQGTVQDTHEGGRSNHLSLQTPVHFNHDGSEEDLDMEGDVDSSHDFSHDDMGAAMSSCDMGLLERRNQIRTTERKRLDKIDSLNGQIPRNLRGETRKTVVEATESPVVTTKTRTSNTAAHPAKSCLEKQFVDDPRELETSRDYNKFDSMSL